MSFEDARGKESAKTLPWARPLSFCLALVALSACSGKDDGGSRNTASTDVAMPKLPPSISASHTFRCNDNGLIFIDFLSDGTTLNLRTAKQDPPVQLMAPAPALSFVGDKVTLTVKGKVVIMEQYKGPTRTCRRD